MASIVLLVLVALVSLVPFLTAYTLRYSLQLVGWWLRSKTRGRRNHIFERLKIEEEVYRKQKKLQQGTEDEEWEKVEGYSAGTAPNGQKAAADLEGRVGCFHPFW